MNRSGVEKLENNRRRLSNEPVQSIPEPHCSPRQRGRRLPPLFEELQFDRKPIKAFAHATARTAIDSPPVKRIAVNLSGRRRQPEVDPGFHQWPGAALRSGFQSGWDAEE